MEKKHFQIIEDFLSKSDWRIKENANVAFSLSSLILQLSGYCIADYTLHKLYKDMEISKYHNEGLVHIHDLNLGLSVYCSGWGTINILKEGINGIDTKVSSAPAKHLRTAINHLVNFIGCVSNEAAGAQALNSLDVYLSGLIYSDYQEFLEITGGNESIARRLIEREVKQCVQEFIFHLNYPTRWGSQPPFTNVTLDLTVPGDLAYSPVWTGKGYDTKVTYKDLQDFVDLFNKYFFQVMYEGDAEGKGFTFPVVTINYDGKTFDTINQEVAEILLKSIAKFGTCYIQNCKNGYIGGNKKLDPSSARAMCCRLQLDLHELQNKVGGIFGAGDYTGSIGVVTISLPMIAYLTRDKKQFFKVLEVVMEEAQKSLLKKRETCIENLRRGLLPFFKRYLPTEFKTHFNTIGYVGMHEALRILGYYDGIIDEKGREFGIEILKFMRDKLSYLQERDGVLCNLEATPSEGASYRLARIAKKRFPDIITSGSNDVPYFTNSCHPPAEYQGDIAFLINNQEELQTQHTGGTVVHFYIGELLDTENVKYLIDLISSTKIPYFSLTTVYSWCPVHGYIPGKHSYCPYPHTEEDLKKYGVDIENVNFKLRG